MNQSQRSTTSQSIYEKRSEVCNKDYCESRSLYGGSRHYQKKQADSQVSESQHTESSWFTYNGQSPSVFIRNVKEIGKTDHRKASEMWNNYVNMYQKHADDVDKINKINLEKKFAKDVKEDIWKKLKRERKEQLKKMQLYKDALVDQRDTEEEKNKT